MGLLLNIHSEAKTFEILNNSLNSVTKSKYSEVLLFDKVHRVLYGYPVNTETSIRNLCDLPENLFNKTQVLTEEKENIKDLKYTFNCLTDLPVAYNDDLHLLKCQEITIVDESLTKYCILQKEIVNSASSYHSNMWNKMLDCPLPLKSGFGQSQFHKAKIPKLIYFPLCNSSREVVGILRIFPNSDEVLDSDIIDKLTR